MSEVDYTGLGYETFKQLAKNTLLNQHERVGFPSWYRDHKIDFIFNDILAKLSNLNSKKIRFLEIGPGWSDLTKKILDFCEENEHEIVLIDSQEMLDLVPSYEKLTKIPAKFPEEITNISNLGKFDAILTYSVIQYPFAESNIFKFVDTAVNLLDSEGQFLIGDIPNISMKKRFLDSQTAKIYHEENHGKNGEKFPAYQFNVLELDQIDDGVLMGLLVRLRASGFHAFLMPQGKSLPMSNRREDLLIVKP